MEIRIDYGGNIVKKLSLGNQNLTYFAKEPYYYYISEVKNEEILSISNLKFGTIYLLEKDFKAEVEILDTNLEQMRTGDSIQFQNTTLKVKIRNGNANFLIAGVEGKLDSEAKGIELNRNEKLYKVNKPWGNEIWINGEHFAYAFKRIFIKKGYKTSLQYHKLKQETNVLIKGKANLHYKSSSKVDNDNVSNCDIDQILLTSISSVDVRPFILHRLEAITDIILYEISTPHLDDVIRVNDDTNRPDGRIKKEHKFE